MKYSRIFLLSVLFLFSCEKENENAIVQSSGGYNPLSKYVGDYEGVQVVEHGGTVNQGEVDIYIKYMPNDSSKIWMEDLAVFKFINHERFELEWPSDGIDYDVLFSEGRFIGDSVSVETRFRLYDFETNPYFTQHLYIKKL